MPSIDEVLKVTESAEPRTRSETIPLDPKVIARLGELEAAVKRARRDDASASIAEGASVARTQAELDAYRAEVEHTFVKFTFRELKRPEWNAVARRYPSTDPRWAWDADLFEPALVAASCVDPQMDEEQARRLFGSLGTTGAQRLFVAAFNLQDRGDRVPFGVNGSDVTPVSEPNSKPLSDSDDSIASS